MEEDKDIAIEVLAHFKPGGGLRPQIIKYGGRKYPIKQVSLVHSITDGAVRIYFFSVSDDTNFWRLGFNTQNLRWWIEDQYSKD